MMESLQNWTAVFIWCSCLMFAVPFNKTALNDTVDVGDEIVTTNHDLFEGDLKISKEVIMNYYNFSSIPEGHKLLLSYLNNSNQENQSTISRHLNRRAAGSRIKLWENGIVSYVISRNMPDEATINILTAMEEFEEHTCLRFLSSNGVGDYIEFTNTDYGCYSTSVGRRGGRQVINLKSPHCYHVHVILHEIAHAIGFWHEQSRPDRDQYVTVQWGNVDKGINGFLQFLKRNEFSIDYQGSKYDYGSVMHYPQQAFSKYGCHGEGCITLAVNNPEEYAKQGSPVLGPTNMLSREDIIQTNRLYSCPRPGIRGYLIVVVRHGISVRDTDGLWNNPDPYVSIRATDSGGNSHNFRTSTVGGSRNPVWNEVAFFGEGSWQFFRIGAWDDDLDRDDQVTMSETIPVSAGRHNNLRHCENLACAGYIIYDYFLDTSVREITRLRINIRFARQLRDTDPIWNKPDPFVQTKAFKSDDNPVLRRSRTISGTVHPVWNEIIDYGCNNWHSIIVEVKDDDGRSSDSLSDKLWIQLHTGHHTNYRQEAYDDGILIFDYSLIVDSNDCSSNLCYNGGTCIDKCTGYLCKCSRGFMGDRCQHLAGNLRLTARHARNLPDSDGWLNNSDPYMEFIAVDVFGKTKWKRSRSAGGNHNPDWNEALDFGYGAWRSIKVRVYDSDWGADDPLSDEQTIQITNHKFISNLRHNCYAQGYAVFDLTFN